VVYAEDEIDRHRQVFDEMWTRALDNSASIDRIAAAADALRESA
jgi:hypothetical protein